MDPESPNKGFRRSVLGDQAFTKEELALKSIRDEATKEQEESSDPSSLQPNKIPTSYQKHVAKLDAKKKEAAENPK